MVAAAGSDDDTAHAGDEVLERLTTGRWWLDLDALVAGIGEVVPDRLDVLGTGTGPG